jgi:nitroimidazol reductase NimA-like FMN-containing flavoprotein (pyridoxamine 5'-phosphate oxidase superfamily)
VQVEYDRNGLEVLDRHECLRLLAGVPIGRVGITSGALPVVLPVNFVLDGERIVIRTVRGSKHDAAIHNTVVAFEADDFDPIEHTGWSVVVTGTSCELTDPDDVARAATLPLRRWAEDDGGRDRFVSISCDVVSGRRVAHPVPLATSRAAV